MTLWHSLLAIVRQASAAHESPVLAVQSSPAFRLGQAKSVLASESLRVAGCQLPAFPDEHAQREDHRTPSPLISGESHLAAAAGASRMSTKSTFGPSKRTLARLASGIRISNLAETSYAATAHPLPQISTTLSGPAGFSKSSRREAASIGCAVGCH